MSTCKSIKELRRLQRQLEQKHRASVAANRVKKNLINVFSDTHILTNLTFLDTQQPLEPMLCQPITLQQLQQLNWSEDNYVYEEKYDGERLVVVINDNNNVAYYTRNLKPRTCLYFKFCLRAPVKRAILDGELVYINPDTGNLVPFCDLGHKNMLRAEFRVFDVQYVDGAPVYTQPLISRRETLERILDTNDQVSLIEQHTVQSYEQLLEAFNQILQRNGEGLIIKSKDSIYMPGKRKWMKMKTLHIHEMREEFDLYIDSVTNDRTGQLGILDCGYYNDENKYVHVCHVSSGIDRMKRGQLTSIFNNPKHERLAATIVADKITNKGSLRHPWLKCLRPDLEELKIDSRILAIKEKQ